MAAKSKKLWVGFLEAGAKGGPVVRDPGLDTGDPKTVYLFNFMKGKILEYRRDIVEVKLRELETEELAMAPELRKAYKQVRETFEPRTVKPRRPVFRARPEPALDEVPDTDDDFGLDTEIPLITDTDDEGAPSDLFG